MELKQNISISENGFLFDANTGDSYSVNEIAGKILSHLKDGKEEMEIKTAIQEEYEVDDLTFERNYYDFTNLLNHLGLLTM